MTQPSATTAIEARVGVVRADRARLHRLDERLRDLKRARHGDALVGAPCAASSSAMAPAASSSRYGLVVGGLDDQDVRTEAARALQVGRRRDRCRLAGHGVSAIRRWPTMRSPKASRPT